MSEEEIDYTGTSPECSPLSSNEYTDPGSPEMASQPEPDSPCRTTRNKIYQKSVYSIRKGRIAETGNNNITHPMGKTPTLPASSLTQTSNTFEAIQMQNEHEVEEEEEIDEENQYLDAQQSSSHTSNTTSNKMIKPPPIILRQVIDSTKPLKKLILETTHKGFDLKRGNNSVTIQLYNYQEFLQLKTVLTNKKYQFHTYTPRQERNHAFVVGGLDAETELDEIKEELQTKYKIPVRRVIPLRKTKTPLFMVTTDNTQTLSKMQRTIPILNYTRVTWRRYQNNRVSVQCRNCQQWGHATTNCHAEARCVKCAGQHSTRQCTKPYEVTPKCINCSGPHTACSTECPTYQAIETNVNNRLERMRKQNEPQPRYVPAQPPRNNYWLQRQGQMPPPPQTQQQTAVRVHDTAVRMQTTQQPATQVTREAESWPRPGEPRVTRKPASRQLEEVPNLEETSPPGPMAARVQDSPRPHPDESSRGRGSPPEPSSPITINDINDQLERLEELVDLEKLWHYLKVLNSKLESAKTSSRKFEIFLQCFHNIDKHGL